MKERCASCRQQLPLREFDLGGGQFSASCSSCADERLRNEDAEERSRRLIKLEVLEKQRAEMVVALLKIDGEIADLRPRVRPRLTPPQVVFEGSDVDTDSVFGDDADRSLDELS